MSSETWGERGWVTSCCGNPGQSPAFGGQVQLQGTRNSPSHEIRGKPLASPSAGASLFFLFIISSGCNRHVPSPYLQLRACGLWDCASVSLRNEPTSSIGPCAPEGGAAATLLFLHLVRCSSAATARSGQSDVC